MQIIWYNRIMMHARAHLLKNLNRFQGLWRACENAYRELDRAGRANHGHGFYDHDLAVAQYGTLIAPDERTGELAWIAGLLHSTDHFYPDRIGEIVRERLALLPQNIAAREKELVVDAVLRHEEANSADDSPVSVTLKDADRLANIGALVIARSGQFFPAIPAADPAHLETRDPASIYWHPTSVLEDLRDLLQYEAGPYGLRLARAREIAGPRFQYLREYLNRVAADFKHLGIIPWPPEK